MHSFFRSAAAAALALLNLPASPCLHGPFKGSQDAANALLGGQVDLVIDGLGLGLARTGSARGICAE